jgi:hypothetical protein
MMTSELRAGLIGPNPTRGRCPLQFSGLFHGDARDRALAFPEIDRGCLGDIVTESFSESASIVGIDLCVMRSPRNGDVGEAAVQQFQAFFGEIGVRRSQ